MGSACEKTSMDSPPFLTGQLLLAMPGMGDARFEQAVIVMAAHDEEGAIGVGIGHERLGLTLRDLLKQLDIDPREAPGAPVHHGGPVEPGRGFVLHSTDWAGQDTVQVAGLCALTGTQDVLHAIAEGKGPSRYVVSLGYAGWDGGQLEGELTQHGWFTVPASEDILFENTAEQRWSAAFRGAGIDPALLVGEAGEA